MDRVSYRVLIADGAPAVRQVLGGLLGDFYRLSLASSVEEILALLDSQQIDALLLDEGLLGRPVGQQLVERIKSFEVDLAVLLLSDEEGSPEGSDLSFVETRLARGSLASETGRARLLVQIDRGVHARRRGQDVAFRRRQDQSAAQAGANLLIGTSQASSALRDAVARASRSELNLLLTGETGVGKTLVAEAVHHLGDPNNARPFVIVDPATLPPSLFESELFGHARGAFTGASAAQVGAFEAARGGTLLLDEIGDLQHPLQVKLLRAVETKVIRRIGDPREIRLAVRIIAASNRDLEADVASGRFRADLYQRLNEIRVHIPPLRERREDVIPLLDHLLGEYSLERSRPCSVTRGAAEMLLGYHWPGNVRELRTLVRRLVDQGLPDEITAGTLIPLFPARLDRGVDSDLGPEGRIRAFGRRVYLEELARREYNIRDTARALGLPYPTLRSRLKSLELIDVVREKSPNVAKPALKPLGSAPHHRRRHSKR